MSSSAARYVPARVTTEEAVDRVFKTYWISLASKADCTDAVAAEVLKSPEDLYALVLPEVLPPQVSLVVKIILCIVCCIIWAGLWFYHEWTIKKLKVEAVVRKAEEAEMEKMEKIKEGLEAEN